MHVNSLAQGVSNRCEESVTILTCDGRLLVGTLIGHDQVQNLILNDAQERIYSEDEDVELVPLGLYVIRGDNVAIVGDATWSETDTETSRFIAHAYDKELSLK